MISTVTLRAKTIFKVKLYTPGSARRHDLAAKFWQKSAVQLFAHSKAIERLNTERQERFANMETREFFALKHDYPPARFRE
ncbi:MAG TPA: hypothetical protein VEP30_09125 [Chthoniobacterales bacterium]|nr:hypothetical protein [Chthoniobacterales bacterium]